MAESNIKGIFGIGDIRSRQLRGLVPERTRETYREYGYFGGGGTPTVSTLNRVDYSNDTATASVRGPLSGARRYFAGTSNSNFGYFSSANSSIDRINYSNDSSQALPRGFLSLYRSDFAATGNNNFGYFGAGYTPSVPNVRSIVDRIDYSNDNTTALVRGSLSKSRYGLLATGNSNFGYYTDGSPDGSALCDRINYSNDSVVALVRGSLIQSKQYGAATGNSNFGYFGGGLGEGTAVERSSISRITYSNDTVTSSPRGSLSLARRAVAATGNSNFGYFGGGNPQPSTPRYSTIDRIDYSNDTVTASLRGPLSVGVGDLAATSSASFGGSPNSSYASNFTFPTVPNAGYFGGGSDGTNNLATIDKVDYANDTSTASVRSALSSARSYATATGNSSFGYFCGGSPNPSTVNRLEYASDTQNTTVRGSLAVGQGSFNASVGDANFGYVGAVSAMNRIDYSNDLSTASNRGSLLPSVNTINGNSSAWSSTSSRSFGYFTGGYASGYPIWSGIQRLDFNNDTLVTSTRSFIPSPVQFGMSGFGNNNFGYFGGGLTPGSPTTIRKIDYSNDTTTVSIRGPLSRSVNYLSSATGSQNFGYFGGGRNPAISPSTITSQVDRINYSNDTAIASIRGPLSSARSQLSATSPLAYGGAPIYFTNPLPTVFQKQIDFNDSNTLSSNLPFKRALGSFGYFGGGRLSAGPRVSTIDRIDYTNDLVTASIRGPLSGVTYFLAATSNSNFGYFGSGRNDSTELSTLNRVDYSNDSTTVSTRQGLITRIRLSATGNNNFGYFGGGTNATIERVDYSNDLTQASARTLVKAGTRRESTATGNNSFGYFGGGDNLPATPAVFSSVERINYSNDLSSTLFRGPLSLARRSLTSTGNSNFGYFGGGYAPGTVATVDRIDYSNDTALALVRGSLTVQRLALAATGNSNFGYFGAGSTPVGVSASTDRLNYSNDTTSTISRGPLSAGRRYLAATTNARSS